MSAIPTTVTAYLRSRGCERGATAVEYSFIVAFIAAVIVVVVGLVGVDTLDGFNAIEDLFLGNDG